MAGDRRCRALEYEDQSRTGVRERLLAAARQELTGPDYDLLAGLTLAGVAERAGVPLRTAKRAFKIDELKTCLREDLLRVRPGEDIDTEDLIEYSSRLINAPQSLSEEMGGIVEAVLEHNIESELFRAVLAFWGLSHHDDEVQLRIHKMYEQWIRDSRNGLNAMIANHADRIALRTDWITIEDFVRAMIAFLEGLAIQESTARRKIELDGTPLSDVQAMHPELPRRIMMAVMASMIEAPDLPTAQEVLDSLDG